MNKPAVVVIALCLFVLFGVPLFFRGDKTGPPMNATQLIIISPHNELIRYEFGRGFTKWYKERFAEDAQVVWSVPGGTSEIRRMLISQYTHALETGDTPGGEADLVFGGGTFEHGVLKNPITIEKDGEEFTTTISAPAGIAQSLLNEVYGATTIGDTPLYDPDGYWYGVALSGFGIVYNIEILEELGIEAPTRWEALCNPKLLGRLALVNPAQSGSVTTAFEAVLKNLGWTRGWQVLRRAAANARYFSASSLKPPADVSQGDAAMGVCIDFYGRYQSQVVKQHNGEDRVGYIDPPGATMIDPDPISLLRGAPNKELAIRFIEFCMTREAQSLWQFRADEILDDGLGPEMWELRRMPVRREMYTVYIDRMVDQVFPYETARPSPFPDRNMRAFIAPLFSAMAMNQHNELVAAWKAIITHPAYPDTIDIVTAPDVTDPELASMLRAFDSLPTFQTMDQGNLSMDTQAHREDLKYGWLRDRWNEEGFWHPEDKGSDAFRRVAAVYFRNQYRSIIDKVYE